MSGFIIGVIIAVVIIFWVIAIYNGLVRLRTNRENAFADIDVQLKQRHDLIPQLVSAVKGYMNHESEVLLAVTQARKAAESARTVNDKIQAEKQLDVALRGFNV